MNGPVTTSGERARPGVPLRVESGEIEGETVRAGTGVRGRQPPGGEHSNTGRLLGLAYPENPATPRSELALRLTEC
ncbi:hypothetical protein SHIRM173S_11338 [Streptomyces hirsutus]